MILMSNNNVPLGSISMQILTLEDSYIEWPQIKIHKCMTLAAQLHLLDTLNNANVRKCYFFSIFEELFKIMVGYGSFTKPLLEKG